MNDTTFQGSGKITYVPVVVNAKQHKQTNADKIRSMTDEELAEWIADVLDHCDRPITIGKCKEDCPLYRCCHVDDSIEEWLKSAVEEVDNG